MIKNVFFLCVFLCTLNLFSNEWPNYGGPNRDQVSNETGLRIDWKKTDPEVIWDLEIGLGYSSVIYSNGFAFSQGYNDGRNTLYCVKSDSGEIIWEHSFPCEKDPKYFDGGSRSTPTIAGEMIFLCSHEGDLYALESKSGKVIWTKNLKTDFEGRRPTWGYSGSPLYIDNKLILETGSANGSVICLNAKTGDLIWKSGDSEAGYASPMLYRKEKDQILIFNQSGIVVHDLKSGNILGKYQHKTRYGINAAQPITMGNRIFVSSAYGKGAALVDFSRRNPSSIWESESFSCQMASLVKWNNYGFGIHGQAGGKSDLSKFFCVDLETGKERWSKKGFGLGTVILVRDVLVVLSDRGELSLVEANPNRFEELFTMQVLSGKNNWIPPTFADGKMHCRSSKGKWVCLAMGI